VFAYPYGLGEDDPLFQDVRGMEDVEAVAPFIQSMVLTQSEYATDHPMIRGVDVQHDFLFRNLLEDQANTLEAGTFDLDEMQCLIGVDLARNLGVRVGDRISVFSPATFAREDEILLPEDLEVVGVFRVGMYQIDQGFVLTDLQTARDVLGMDQGVHGMQVLGTDLMGADDLAEDIMKKTDYTYEARSWMQMNQALFNALTMEKGMMFFLLAIISIVASFLVSSTLIMVSVQKTREIGLLKSMGFRNRTVMGVFMWYGLIQGVIGILAGMGAGVLILHCRQSILQGMSNVLGMEVLPKELYYLESLPSKIVPEDVALIGLLVLGLCLIGGAVPAWLAARKNPVEALRHD